MRTVMKSGALAALILLLALVWAAGPASAKGKPPSVMISGPGIDEPVEVQDAIGIYDTGLWTALFDRLVLGAARDVDPALTAAPTKDLGPRHTLTWRFFSYPACGDVSDPASSCPLITTPIRQDLYLDAAGGSVVYTPPGQPFRDSVTVEGWFPLRDGLRDDLVAAGVPLTGDKLTADKTPAGEPAPAPSGDPVWPEVLGAGAGGLTLAGAGALAVRRARRVAPLSA